MIIYVRWEQVFVSDTCTAYLVSQRKQNVVNPAVWRFYRQKHA